MECFRRNMRWFAESMGWFCRNMRWFRRSTPIKRRYLGVASALREIFFDFNPTFFRAKRAKTACI
ncbi:MAG: hypothetical protein CMO66_05910 [Verrucomicrobiales bacterium]|nr:hypothetical protein [Verrucomicrobiales bacterium]